ncbi:MAG: hypothetical protein HZA95_00145 [Candidatus Vogelbacteria bacterium]|nr:hypothetical protein [Candidatus Vogelbacteria bacterium]
MVFQGRIRKPNVIVEKEFSSAMDFGRAITAFAAMQSGVRDIGHVSFLFTRDPGLPVPNLPDGLGPDTWLVIEDMELLEPKAK